MTCKWKLIRQFHEGEYELTLGKNAIGRNVNSEVRCSSLFVSRTHCIIEVSEDLIKIIDNKSSNGTYVNYNMIPTDTYHTLYDNDIIGLGVAGDQSLSEEFFRSIGDESIDIDNKRIKIENEASFDDDDNDNMLLNYTQSDNDIVVISDDESSMVQKFEKSFKSSGIVENLDQPNDRLLMEIDEDLSESNNEIICLDSDNEDDDVDKWINKLSQNFSMKGNKSLVTRRKKDLVDLEEYDFIANSESNDQNALPEPPTSSTITPSKKTYIKPPIIECPVNMIPRRKSSTGSTLENKSKEKAIQKTVKSEKSKPISKSKRNSVKKLKSIEKGEKKIIGQIRKNRLKELADKTAPPKEFNDSPKIVSKPKVKFTENNRGAFLTDNIPVVPCNKNDSKTKTKNDASLPKVSDLPKIPKKTRIQMITMQQKKAVKKN
ncbi:uncharacterized protein LOC113366546 [Ctenocephalides felis]|uniref:uncharacterized protein LOC113366546 n=1 Tax=Ctenocephalides felis TaxID=7515 RepID=UPI000E6E15F2|nr:uncharacterized protein LOC113366546 [Ctenocephalides felis]